jgi:hypothetical protein
MNSDMKKRNLVGVRFHKYLSAKIGKYKKEGEFCFEHG